MRKQLARQGAVFVAFVYIAGLLIVNIDLGLYGTSYIELARAQYLLVGSMWFLFSIAFPIGSAAAWVTARKKFSPTVTWAMGAVAVAAGFIPALLVCYIARWSTRDMYNQVEGTRTVLAIAVGCAALYVLLAWWWAYLLKDRDRLASSQAVLAGFTATLILLVGIYWYSKAVFRVIGHQFGGGARPFVELLLTESLPGSCEAEGRAGTWLIRAKALVLETADTFILSFDGRPIPGAEPELRRDPTISIPRARVRAIAYWTGLHQEPGRGAWVVKCQ